MRLHRLYLKEALVRMASPNYPLKPKARTKKQAVTPMPLLLGSPAPAVTKCCWHTNILQPTGSYTDHYGVDDGQRRRQWSDCQARAVVIKMLRTSFIMIMTATAMKKPTDVITILIIVSGWQR